MFRVMKVEQRAWSNWSGLVHNTPEQIVYPESVAEIIEAIQQANARGRQVRVMGSGHSFTPLLETNQTMLSLDRIQGIREVNEEQRIADVWAGTKLNVLGDELCKRGLAQENLGDINKQSIAGAFSSGTHGTGTGFGIISTQIAEMTAVTGNGELITCSESEHPDVFKAMLVSLGALGVITDVRLKLVPATRMHFKSYRMTHEQVLSELDKLNEDNRHFEFYWFPHTDQVQVKVMNETIQPATKNGAWNHFNKLVLENGAFWVLSQACRSIPRLCAPVSRVSAALIPMLEEVGYTHELFATPRLVRFSEMEYNIPAAAMKPALEEIRACVEKHRYAVHFPIECRYVKGDDIWLSPAYGRDSAYIAVHMFKGMPHKEYFAAIERILLSYGGRPHWGKLHTLKADQLSKLYPRWNEFMDVRRRLDANGVLLNPYLKSLFGISET